MDRRKDGRMNKLIDECIYGQTNISHTKMDGSLVGWMVRKGCNNSNLPESHVTFRIKHFIYFLLFFELFTH